MGAQKSDTELSGPRGRPPGNRSEKKSMKPFNRRTLLLGLATLALAACTSSPKPTTLFRIQDPNVDLHTYRSFAFHVSRPHGYISAAEERLYEAARNQLERRGYEYQAQSPDMLVNIGAVIEERQGQRLAAGQLESLDGAGREHYRMGRMAIDLIDSKRHEVIWRGVAEGPVSAAMLRDPGTSVEKAVAEIFKGFPVGVRARNPTDK
ncbi:DUF4136 domain-containing protein [Caldimonas sp. KR1-144]|uniref:DUF4136 domain-containing protein n=1 Tax=Caldimonas sp. KR1-144 TaxID=3400911 RepID=UPI003BFCFF5E